MNYQQLKKALVIDQGKVTISQKRLTAAVSEFLKVYYQNKPIVITGAEPEPGDGENGAVVISGKSSFLNVPDVPVTASFSLDSKGNVQALLKYQLRDDMPGPKAWTFSRSFPKLPPVLNYDTAVPAVPDESTDIYAGQKPYLDALYLFDTYFVVSTYARQEPESGVPLQPGINFVSKVRPGGMLGVLEHAGGGADPLTLYGTIRIPKATDRTLPLKPLERVLDRTTAPGIHLKAPLDMDFKLGKMTFHRAALRIYSPPSTDWLQKNSSFQPAHGYAGRLSIPSAGIEVDLSANLRWGMPEALLYADCKGVTLGKLAHLMDIAGTGSLSSSLPGDLQKAVDKLEKLELMHVALDIGLDGSVPTVGGVYVTIGMPDLNWKVWGDDLEVRSISCRFEVENPFGGAASAFGSPSSRRSVSVMVMGTVEIEGVPVAVSARSNDNFTLYARLEGQQTIPLKKLMTRYAPGVPAPSDLTVDGAMVTVAPGRFYAMSAAMADKPKPWVIPLGKSNLSVSDVMMNLRYPKGGPVSGSFAGTAALGKDLSFSMAYDIPGGVVIRGNLPEAKLSQLIARLSNQKAALPGKFDLDFETSSVLIQKQNGSFVFQLATEVESLGSFAFEARKVSGSQWGFAAGMDLSAGSPSKVPGLSAISRFEKAFHLQRFMLVASSFESAAFRFPDLAQFNNPRLGAKKLSLPGQANGVTAGLNIFGEWALDTKNKQHKLLKNLLGLDPTLGVTLQLGADPAKNAKLFVRHDAKINGHPFDCEFGAMVQNGDIGLFLTGTVTLKIQKKPQTFDVTMLFVENGAFMSADMKGPSAVAFGPLKLSDLALEVGVDWEGIPSLGVAATLDVGKFDSSIAVFFDSADPAKSLVAGAVSNLTLKDVVHSLIGTAKRSPLDGVLDKIGVKGTHQFKIPAALANDLNHRKFDKVSSAFQSAGGLKIPASSSQLHLVSAGKGSVWYLTDLTTMRHYQLKKQGSSIQVSVEPQFYFAPLSTTIGTTRFPQGFYINGALDFLGFDASATIDISTNKGVAVDAEMDQIVIGNEFLFCIKADKGKGGPKVSAATFSQPRQPVKEFRPPHFYINGQLEMLGLSEGIYITLSPKGFAFDLNGHLLPGIHFDLNGYFASPKHLGVSGTLEVGIGTINLGKLGKVKIDTDFECSIGIKVEGSKISASAGCTFEAAGKKMHIPSLELDVNTHAFKDLPKTLEKEAGHVLGKFFEDALKDLDKAQKNVDKINGKIAHLRETIKKNRAKNLKKYNDARKKVRDAQSKVDDLKKQKDKALKQIHTLEDARRKKKEWATHGNVLQKATRHVAYVAYAAEKDAEIAGLYTEIEGIETAQKTADAALILARQPIKGLAALTKVTPVDMDPRIAALFTGRDTATAALKLAKLPLKALVH